jgi:hypothetical protein
MEVLGQTRRLSNRSEQDEVEQCLSFANNIRMLKSREPTPVCNIRATHKKWGHNLNYGGHTPFSPQE